MKLKKGSKEAAAFMAKLRASRGKKKPAKKLSGVKAKPAKPVYVTILGQRVKVGTKLHSKLVAQKKHFDDLLKSELSGTKKKTVKRSKAKKVHTDVKSHNYKISISGVNMYSELDKLEKDLMYYETMKNFYTKSLKGVLKSGVDKAQQRKNLTAAKDRIKIAKRRIKEQKTLIRKSLI